MVYLGAATRGYYGATRRDFGGVYGSGVPGAIGRYCFKLSSNSATIFMIGPADNEGPSYGPFHVGKVVATPLPRRSVPRPSRFWPVVTCKHDNRVVADAEFIDGVHDLPNMRI